MKVVEKLIDAELGGGGVIDSSLSITSVNAVQNKVITNALKTITGLDITDPKNGMNADGTANGQGTFGGGEGGMTLEDIKKAIEEMRGGSSVPGAISGRGVVPVTELSIDLTQADIYTLSSGKYAIIAKDGAPAYINTSVFGSGYTIVSAAYGNGVYVVLIRSGSKFKLFYSADGVNFQNSSASFPALYPTYSGGGTWPQFYRVVFAGGRFFAGQLTSEDGINWVPVSGISNSSLYIISAAYGNGIYMISVYYGESSSSYAYYFSRDGVSFNVSRDVSTITAVPVLLFLNGFFITFINNRLFKTSDGVLFSEEALNFPNKVGNTAGFYEVSLKYSSFFVVGNHLFLFDKYSGDRFPNAAVSSDGANWTPVSLPFVISDIYSFYIADDCFYGLQSNSLFAFSVTESPMLPFGPHEFTVPAGVNGLLINALIGGGSRAGSGGGIFGSRIGVSEGDKVSVVVGGVGGSSIITINDEVVALARGGDSSAANMSVMKSHGGVMVPAVPPGGSCGSKLVEVKISSSTVGVFSPSDGAASISWLTD